MRALKLAIRWAPEKRKTLERVPLLLEMVLGSMWWGWKLAAGWAAGWGCLGCRWDRGTVAPRVQGSVPVRALGWVQELVDS